jgi:hypothetical protein
MSSINKINVGGTEYNINEVPPGGTTGQVLTKASNTDYNSGWNTPIIYRDNVEVTTNTDTTYTIANLTANQSYKLGTLTSLTITACDTFDEESVIYFTSGTTATILTLPATITQIGDSVEASKSYIIAILNNIAVIKGY